MNIKLDIVPSHLKNKKYDAIFSDGKHTKVVSFGLKSASDYILHHDKERRDRYLNRHYERENWNDPYSKGSLSAHLLWGITPNLDTNIKHFKKKFNFI
jgi:hypothetical protein